MSPIDDDWVVCLGETRSAADGLIACPMRGEVPVPMKTCGECHLLTWRHDEREMAGASCAAGPDSAPSAPAAPALV